MSRITLIPAALLLAAALLSCSEKQNPSSPSNQGGQSGQGGQGGQGGAPSTPQEVEFAAVDLGLSVKWANINLGAKTEVDSGDYYAWGETAVKTNYDWTTYLWCDGNWDKLKKYNSDPSYGTVDGEKVLQRQEKTGETMDDVARGQKGGSWRIPTVEDWNELIEQCDWKPETRFNVFGYVITSKASGNKNSIFLPGVGYMSGTRVPEEDESTGFYWSSVRHSAGMPFYAWHLSFTKMGTSSITMDATTRCFGSPIRAVTD